ncbi:MAG TPA: xylanase deacetylase [Treponema sp.]|nr:xylanase deacetylase [Treponema sp.]HBB42141.1 xylanase deacetylase [Treponema sp.]
MDKLRLSLTFDDGPNTTTSVQVLDVLASHNVKASFFLIGQNITEKSRPVIERQIREGHSVECHSWTHPEFPKLSAEQMTDEVRRTNAVITECTGGIAPVFFRPPFIALNDLMFETIRMPFICGHGVEDWEESASVEHRVRGVLENAHDGQIILLHDTEGNGKTVLALKEIIPALKERGAEFFTVRDLFRECGVDPVRPASEKKIWTDLF